MNKLGFTRPHLTRAETNVHSLIAAFEQLIGAEFPDDYRTFLGRYGGIILHRGIGVSLIESFGEDDIVRVEQFFGFLARRANGGLPSWDLEYEWEIFSNFGANKLLPICGGPSGDKYCMSLVGNDRGFVYYCDRGHLELGENDLGEMLALLNRHGIDSTMLDTDGIVYEAEKLGRGPRNKPLGYSNLYLVPRSFDVFVQSLYSCIEPDTV